MADNVTQMPNIGKTYHGGTPTTIDKSLSLEGAEQWFKDEIAPTAGNGMATLRSGRMKLCRLVRNGSGIALTPGRAVSWASGYRGTRVGGYCTTTAAECAGIVDDRLPAAGVASNDLFWIVRKGPALCKTDLAGGANNVIAAGDVVVALTAATSQATTAGRVYSAATAVTTNNDTITLNRIGRAMSAKTTANTNADVLIDLDIIS